MKSALFLLLTYPLEIPVEKLYIVFPEKKLSDTNSVARGLRDMVAQHWSHCKKQQQKTKTKLYYIHILAFSPVD